MRRSTRRSSMAVSIHQSLEFDTSKKINTRRSSSILPQFEDTRNVVGNFTTKFSMSSFIKRVGELNYDQRNAIEKVGFGNLLNVHQHTLRKNLLVEWMERWDSARRAFVLHGRELTITAVDAALILGLRATGEPVNLNDEGALSDLEKDYGATSSSRKVSVSALEQRLQSLGDLANEDFTRTFLLFTFGTILFPSSNAKIDSRYLSFLEDLDRICDYAWGMAVVEDVFNWLSKRKEEGTKSMEGCLLLLQIWSYEHIDIGRPNLVIGSVDFPRACRWESSRCNTPRHWFTTKFNELEENQIIWKLQPTEAESDIYVIKELVTEEGEGVEILQTTTNTTTKSMLIEVPSENLSKKSVLNEELEGSEKIGKHDKQDDIQEESRQSSEMSALVEETEGQEVTSTRARSKVTSIRIGLPPKGSSQYAIVGKEPGRVKGRSKLDDAEADIQEDSRQSMDASVITEDFTECSSSYNLQEDHIAETSHYVKGKCVLETDVSQLNDVVELKRENASLRSLLANLRKEMADLKEENKRLCVPPPDDNIEIAELRSQLENLTKEVDDLKEENADLKEDNLRLRAPPPADNIERLIDAYFNGVSDPSEVDLIR